jgi:DNA-binding XRE family transcriptional regulator
MIRDSRKFLGLKHEEMGKWLHVTKQCIYLWENEKRKPLNMVLDLCFSAVFLVQTIQKEGYDIDYKGILLEFGLSTLLERVFQEANKKSTERSIT